MKIQLGLLLCSLGYAQTPAPQQVQTAGCVWNGQPCVPVPQPGTANPSLNHTQEPQAATVTISPQPSKSVPYQLPAGLSLYSAVACAPTSTRIRVISAGQIRQIAEGAGIAFTDPALLPPMITRYVGRTVKGRLLSFVKDVSSPAAAASGTVAAVKTQLPNVGNASTWAYIAVGSSVIAVLVPMIQGKLQSDVQATQATITNGVNAALITSMEAVYTVPVGGCSASKMFLGSGNVGIVRSVIQ